VREYTRCLDESRAVSSASHPLQIDSFLMTADRLVDLGRQARAAKRGVTGQLLRRPPDCVELYLLAGIADNLERAAMSLSRCGPMLRDYVVITCFFFNDTATTEIYTFARFGMDITRDDVRCASRSVGGLDDAPWRDACRGEGHSSAAAARCVRGRSQDSGEGMALP